MGTPIDWSWVPTAPSRMTTCPRSIRSCKSWNVPMLSPWRLLEVDEAAGGPEPRGVSELARRLVSSAPISRGDLLARLGRQREPLALVDEDHAVLADPLDDDPVREHVRSE